MQFIDINTVVIKKKNKYGYNEVHEFIVETGEVEVGKELSVSKRMEIEVSPGKWLVIDPSEWCSVSLVERGRAELEEFDEKKHWPAFKCEYCGKEVYDEPRASPSCNCETWLPRMKLIEQ